MHVHNDVISFKMMSFTSVAQTTIQNLGCIARLLSKYVGKFDSASTSQRSILKTISGTLAIPNLRNATKRRQMIALYDDLRSANCLLRYVYCKF